MGQFARELKQGSSHLIEISPVNNALLSIHCFSFIFKCLQDKIDYKNRGTIIIHVISRCSSATRTTNWGSFGR